jgi:hypothetical protein
MRDVGVISGENGGPWKMNNVTATLHATLTVNIARYMPVVADVQQEWAVGVEVGRVVWTTRGPSRPVRRAARVAL